MKKTFLYKVLLLLSILCIGTHHRTLRATAAEPIKFEIRTAYGTVTMEKSGDRMSGYITKCDDESIYLESGGRKIKLLLVNILEIEYRDSGKYQNRQVISPIPSVLNPVDQDNFYNDRVTNRERIKVTGTNNRSTGDIGITQGDLRIRIQRK